MKPQFKDFIIYSQGLWFREVERGEDREEVTWNWEEVKISHGHPF